MVSPITEVYTQYSNATLCAVKMRAALVYFSVDNPVTLYTVLQFKLDVSCFIIEFSSSVNTTKKPKVLQHKA